MRVTIKALIIIGITLGLFLPASYFALSHDQFTLYITLCIGAAGIILLLLYYAIFRRISNLAHKTQAEINAHLNNPTPLENKDEITSLAIMLNSYSVYLQKVSDEMKTQQSHNLTLQTSMEKLKREIEREQFIKNNLAPASNNCLTDIARYDDITLLPNRVFFNEILNKSISHAKRHHKFLAILLIDIGIKTESDIKGITLDAILKEIAKRFTTILRSEDVLTKLDSNEFIVLLNDIGKPKFASTVAEKLLNAAKQIIMTDKGNISLDVKIGISIYPHDGLSLEDLLKSTDEALYNAKRIANADYQFFTSTMDHEAHEYRRLEQELRNAVQNNELTLYFQPKLNLKQGRICGVETLLRWEHPVHGLINPAQFIPVAEDTNMIMGIGEWVLLEACKVNKYWQDEGYEHLSVSVNLSDKQFHHPNITTMINNALKKSGLHPRFLEIEITEKTVMDDAEAALQILEDIKKIGVQISIDHFGTGYTSISNLKKFPINTLKIDQSFIKGIPHSTNDLAITSAVISLAHNLGFDVVAEGVETAEQVQYLATQHCDIIQGYFLSHPITAAKIVLQLKKLRDEVLI